MSDSPYQRAADLGEAGKLEAAWKIVNKLLIEDPLDVRALVTGSYIMRRLGALPQAYHLARSATQLWPNDDAAWTNMGHVASEMWLVEESEKCYRKALQNAKDPRHIQTLWLNLSALYLDNGRFADAEALIRKILDANPDHANAKANLGFCQLARRDWANGWKGYHNTIGSDWRPKIQYGDEPEWDGTPGQTVVLYADQGLGDEISFASMLPDALAISKKIILDCDDRLAGLFRRSFPTAKVYGTRRSKDGKWDKEDWKINASLPLGQIGEFFRTDASQFTGAPYLTPCPTRTAMWKGLWTQFRKPIVGVAWTGGVPKSNARNRRVSLEDLVPLFNSVDAHYVSLQYKDAEAEIKAFKAKHPQISLAQYPWGTLTQDYDDTAALIASLDYVVCIQTAVAHTAGALGVPVMVLVPVATQWRYGDSEDGIPWYNCLKIIRQRRTGSWSGEIERTATALHAHFGGVSGGTATSARNDGVRDGIDHVRPAHIKHHKPNGSHPPVGLRVRGENESRQES